MKHKVSSLPPFEISKGFNARLIHTDNLTLAYVDIDDGAALAEHSHVHEQVVNMLEGRFELTVNGVPHILEAGDVFALASNVPHSGRALTKCRILDVFNPVREDFKIGNVVYAQR